MTAHTLMESSLLDGASILDDGGDGCRGGRRQERPTAGDVGKWARIGGLRHHLGKKGCVGMLRQYLEVHDRWKVWLPGEGEKELPPENLELCVDGGKQFNSAAFRAGESVCVRGLPPQHHLNGQEGVILDFSDGSQLWCVGFCDGSELMLPASKIEPLVTPLGADIVDRTAHVPVAKSAFHYGQRVLLTVTASTMFQEEECVIEDYDHGEERWRVRMDDGSSRTVSEAYLQAVRPLATDGHTLNTPALPPGKLAEVAFLHTFPDLEECELGEFVSVEQRPAASRIGRPEDIREFGVELSDGSAAPQPALGVWPVSKLHAARWPIEEGLHATQGGQDNVTHQEQLDQMACYPSRLTNVARVRVKGLSYDTHFNGKVGIPLAFDSGRGMWEVVLDGCQHVFVRQEHVEPIEPMLESVQRAHLDPVRETSQLLVSGGRARICGLQFKPELNGMFCTLGNYLQTEDRWCVFADDGSKGRLRPAHLRPEPPPPRRGHGTTAGFRCGCRVRIRGLTSRPELNGSRGTLEEFVAEEGRWKLTLDDSQRLMLKAKNLQLREQEAAEAVVATSLGGPADLQRARAAPGLQGSSRGRSLVGGTPLSVDEAAGLRTQPSVSAAIPGCPVPLGIKSGAFVRVCGMEVRPDLDGRVGIAVQWDELERRWRVRMFDDGSMKLIEPTNMVTLIRPDTERREECAAAGDESGASFKPGQSVLLVGLNGVSEFNGKHATVVGLHAVDGMVLLEVHGEESLCWISTSNVERLPTTSSMKHEGHATPTIHMPRTYAIAPHLEWSADTSADLHGLSSEVPPGQFEVRQHVDPEAALPTLRSSDASGFAPFAMRPR